MFRTRFAPSPTGELHLGGAWTALASWTLARRARGQFVLRTEDLDGPRTIAGAAAQIVDDLRWLGLDWEEGPDVSGPHEPYAQSERSAHYERALATLQEQHMLYPCDCSRAEIAQVASAPHEGEAVYPGLCRDRDPRRPMKRPPAWRVRVPDRIVHFIDELRGPQTESLREQTGDFVLKRGDGLYAYQLAVVVDDAAMGITHVVRGDDLLASTARQIFLFEALSLSVPRFLHLPLVLGPTGERLAKRNPVMTISGLRGAGIAANAIVGKLACGLGLRESDAPVAANDMVKDLNQWRWRAEPWKTPATW